MLYDPKWEKPKPSLAGFHAWLEQQNEDATFHYADCNRCAVGQYLNSIGTNWTNTNWEVRHELNWFAMRAAMITNPQNPTFGPITFGAVLRAIDNAHPQKQSV
jgi:hypothetical protein